MRTSTSPPLTYAVADIEDRDQLELKLVIDERTIKERIPIYKGDSEETLLVLIKEYKNLIDTYDLWDQENADRNVYFDFRRCLRDSARDDWDLIVEIMDDEGEERGQQAFEAAISSLIESSLSEQAYIRQRTYLRSTPKPRNLSVKKWVNRILTINSFLPLMEIGAQRITEKDIITDVITPNIPIEWKSQYLLQGLHLETRVSKVVTTLQHLESVEKMVPTKTKNNNNHNDNHDDKSDKKHERSSNTKDESKNNPKGKQQKSFKNECKLEGHKGHEWADCFNNPNSKNFKGKARSLKEDKESNGEKNIKEKKDSKAKTQDNRFVAPHYESDAEESTMINDPIEDESKKVPELSCEALVLLPNKTVTIALLDSGSSASLISKDILDSSIEVTKHSPTKWRTQDGSFITSEKVETKFKLPQFSLKRETSQTFHVMKKDRYDIIIGRDVLTQLGIILNFKNKLIEWDEVAIEMTVLSKQSIPELQTYFNNLMVAKPTMKPASYTKATAGDILEKVTTLSTN